MATVSQNGERAGRDRRQLFLPVVLPQRRILPSCLKRIVPIRRQCEDFGLSEDQPPGLPFAKPTHAAAGSAVAWRWDCGRSCQRVETLAVTAIAGLPLSARSSGPALLCPCGSDDRAGATLDDRFRAPAKTGEMQRMKEPHDERNSEPHQPRVMHRRSQERR
jgi:hypothetical protein